MCLPWPTRCMLEEGVLPSLYVNKMQMMQGPGGPQSVLSLNPFEYYMFHFAYLLVNSSNQTTTVWSNPSDALYPTLAETYFNYFLPTTGKAVPPMPNYAPVRSPVNHHSPVYRQSSTSPQRRTPPQKGHHSLLKSSILLNRSPAQQTNTATAILDQAENEMWRSEALIQILTEFWMNQSCTDTDKMMPQHKDSFLPSSLHVRLVRMMVKHLHYFVNSASTALLITQYNSMSVTALDEFKRAIWPQTAQKLYAFLKNCFSKWPLDSSFRLVLETWLSYIQPYRYQNSIDSHKDAESPRIKTVEMKWKTFVMENLLFYSQLFHELLPRLSRMDLASPKNAYMLFRVTKVFSLPGLKDMLYEAEHVLCESVQSYSPLRQHSAQDLGASYLSMSHSHSGLAASLLMQFSELEGPGFQYRPLFGGETRLQILHLLTCVEQARASADSISTESSSNKSSNSVLHMLGFGSLVDLNAPSFVSSEYHDDFTEVDARKLGQHLEQAAVNLRDLFEVSQPEDSSKSVRWGSSKPENLSHNSTLLPDHIDSDDGIELTPLGRYQIMNGLRKFEVSYQGDPDLQPIRSFECGVLVRLLYHVSWYFNQKFSKQINEYYEREDFVGNMAYQLLHPPSPVTASRTKSPLTKRQMAWAKKPRLSLRPLASYQNLGYLLAFYLYLYMWWGFGFVGFTMLMLVVVFLYGAARAVMMPRPKLKHS